MKILLRLVLFAMLVGTWPAVLRGQWPDEYRIGRFLYHADFPLADDRLLLQSIPRLQQQLVEVLQLQDSQEPIYVFLFARKSTYDAYLQQYFPQAPSRKALFIKGRGPGMVFAHRGEDFEVDVRHECTHAVLNATLPMVPLWLDEGLAEYFEIDEQQRRLGSPHLRSVKWSARLGQAPRLEELEQIGQLSQMGRSEYRQAWAWVHFMLHGPPEARETLCRYLADIQALTPPGQLSRRLHQRLPDLEREFLEHFKGW